MTCDPTFLDAVLTIVIVIASWEAGKAIGRWVARKLH
jgi:hypothetical protein